MHRWTPERAQRWQAESGWLVGCNFTPSSAGNQLEMWQADSFDAATINRELGWAASLGMNVVRVYLHNLLFEAEGEAFLDRVEQFLDIAHNHDIRLLPVLFDGVWHPRPQLGVQPEPKPRRHNSIWLQAPGSRILHDRESWPQLRPYVDAWLSRFAADPRVLAWDLVNEPDQVDALTLANDSRPAKAEAATGLLNCLFDWARAVNPSQPLTAGLWEYDSQHQPLDNAINRVMLARSDFISFHCYEPRAELLAVIEALAAYQRPLLCTEWLARTAGSTMDLLEVFAQQAVGAINWGLVDGRTQTRFPWRSWTEPVADDEPWFHELLQQDGSPYDQRETALMQQLTGRAGG